MSEKLQTTGQATNTDRELWREKEGDYYSPYVFVTKSGGIGMCASGLCVVQSISQWIKDAEDTRPMESKI